MEYVLRSVFKRVPWAAERSVPSEPVGYSLLCESDVTISVSNKLPIVLQDITTDITHFSPGQSLHIDTSMKKRSLKATTLIAQTFCGFQKTRQLEFSLKTQKGHVDLVFPLVTKGYES